MATADLATSELRVAAEPVERWLPVIISDGRCVPNYQVSNRGRLRSLDHVVVQVNRWGQMVPRRIRGRLLSLARSGRYYTAGLQIDGETKTVFVHRLVIRAFGGPPPDGMECCHGEGGSLDNRWPENLSWGTRPKNLGPDRERDGTLNRGVLNSLAKLDDEKVVAIRLRLAAGEKQRSIAADYGVSQYCISSIARGATWAHVPMPAQTA